MRQLAWTSRSVRFPFLASTLAAVVLMQAASVFGASIIVNEYNAVDEWLDGASGTATDTYFGRVEGNGGDWFELVVIQDHLDIRGWRVDIREGGDNVDDELVFTDHAIWSDLRSGTIITLAEDDNGGTLVDDISYDPAAGDWWINVMVNDSNGGTYITETNIKITDDKTRFEIVDDSNVTIFGPAGEGVQPTSGVNDEEVWKLEADPSDSIVPTSPEYNDGTSSTFGSPNIYGGGQEVQDFSELRAVVPEPGTLVLLACSALALLMFRRR